MSARFEAAVWTGQLYGHAAGAELFGELLDHAQSIDTVAWSFVLDTAWNLGGALLESGDATAAVVILDQIVTESELAYGRKHAHTLPFRITHANAIGSAGDPGKALELTRELVEDSTQKLGKTHLITLQAKSRLAEWTSKTGDIAAAIGLFENILADSVPLFGDDHWLVKEVRAELATLRAS